jgi:REP element-mobilizing transposase RayT
MPVRKRLRLQGYDYSLHGAYLVTVCVAERRSLLGRLVGESVQLSDLGERAKACLAQVPAHHAGVRLDEHVVMPDHVHAILLLPPPPLPAGGARYISPLPHDPPHPSPVKLGVVVGTFKAAVARSPGGQRLWQRGYHDRIIRDERELDALREYVATNPLRAALRNAR